MEQKGQISLVNATLKGMNIMVGAAILAAPSIITAAAGEIGILAWAVSLVFLPIVLSIMRLSQLIDRDGGVYAYSAAALGRLPGFIGGALYYFGYTFATTTVLSLLRILMLAAFPGAFILQNIYAYYAVAVGLIAVLNLVNMAVQDAIVIPAILMKFSPLFIVIACLPLASSHTITFDFSLLPALPSALTMTIFGFLGFEYALALSRYIVNREENGPRAVVGAFLSTTVLYVLFHIGLLRLMGASNLVALGVDGFPSFLPIASVTVKTWVAILVAGAIKLSYLSSANGMAFGNIETCYGLAKDGLLKCGSFFTITNTNNRPLTAGLCQFAMIFALGTLVPNVLSLANITNFTVLTVFVLSTIALLVTLRKQPKTSSVDVIIGVLGLLASTGLAVYMFYLLGSTWTARFQEVIPLAICVGLSLLMYKSDTNNAAPITPAAKQTPSF